MTEIDAVVADLLEVARAEAGLRDDERTPCALHELVARMLEDRRPPAGIAVRATGSAVESVAVPALARAVGHLLDNAYAHARSEVVVTIKADPHRTVVTVEDDGRGVPPELRLRLFERFATQRSGGTGLGLDLHPPLSKGGSWLVGYFSTRPVREQEARDHLAAIDRTLPTIVAGDFNEEEDGRALAILERAGFANTLPSKRPEATTWRWAVGPVTLRMRLDHILHDDAFRLVDADIVHAGRSDHVPVWAELERCRASHSSTTWRRPCGAQC